MDSLVLDRFHCGRIKKGIMDGAVLMATATITSAAIHENLAHALLHTIPYLMICQAHSDSMDNKHAFGSTSSGG